MTVAIDYQEMQKDFRDKALSIMDCESLLIIFWAELVKSKVLF